MIINLWSTPRTGSVWYSNHIAAGYPNSLLITEMFNRYHMNMYHVRDSDGVIRNYHEYVPEGYYKEYTHDADKNIIRHSVYAARTRNVQEEEEYCWDLLKNHNTHQVLVLHNHIDPINPEIRHWLFDTADQNIWIGRRDRKRQLASYAVAMSTKQFAAFKPQLIDNDIVADCDLGPLKNLVRRIQVWDRFEKANVIYFEDIEFYEREGFPYDQNQDPWLRISPRMQNIIQELLTE